MSKLKSSSVRGTPAVAGAVCGSAKTYPHNPSHRIGTCSKCGDEMVYNVPRMGPDGGFVHKATGELMCPVKHWTQKMNSVRCPRCDKEVKGHTSKRTGCKIIVASHNGPDGLYCPGSRQLLSPNNAINNNQESV